MNTEVSDRCKCYDPVWAWSTTATCMMSDAAAAASQSHVNGHIIWRHECWTHACMSSMQDRWKSTVFLQSKQKQHVHYTLFLLIVPHCKTMLGKRRFSVAAPSVALKPYQHLQQYRCRHFNLSPFWLSYIFLRCFHSRRRIPIRRHEKSEDGTKSPWYESSMVRKVHKWYETSMVRKVYGTKSLVPKTTSRHGLTFSKFSLGKTHRPMPWCQFNFQWDVHPCKWHACSAHHCTCSL